MDKNQEKFQELALNHAIKILSKKRLTPKDFRNLDRLTKIIFDVNYFNIHLLTDRLYRSQSFVPVSQGRTFQPMSKDSSVD